MEPLAALQTLEKLGGLCRHESDGSNFPAAQLRERGILRIIGALHRDFKKIEQRSRGHCRAASAQIKIHLLLRKIPYAGDIGSGQEMKFKVLELSDI